MLGYGPTKTIKNDKNEKTRKLIQLSHNFIQVHSSNKNEQHLHVQIRQIMIIFLIHKAYELLSKFSRQLINHVIYNSFIHELIDM